MRRQDEQVKLLSAYKDDDNKNAKLIYRGSESVTNEHWEYEADIYVYEQPATIARPYKRLALICYNVDKEEEYPPIYLDGEMVEKNAADREYTPTGLYNYKGECNNVEQYDEDIGAYLMGRISYYKEGISISENFNDKYSDLRVSGPAKELLGTNIVHRRRAAAAPLVFDTTPTPRDEHDANTKVANDRVITSSKLSSNTKLSPRRESVHAVCRRDVARTIATKGQSRKRTRESYDENEDHVPKEQSRSENYSPPTTAVIFDNVFNNGHLEYNQAPTGPYSSQGPPISK